MVLEAFTNPRKIIEEKTWQLIIMGFIYAVVSTFLALWIFKSHVSLVMITLTIIVSIPIVRNILASQGKIDVTLKREKRILI